MQFFQTTFDDAIDPAFLELERCYVDIGKEVCPEVSLLASQALHCGQEPQVYVRRGCCLEEYMRWMYDGQPPKSGNGQTYFHQNMLQDAASLTSVTPKRSKHREGGLIYSQFYASVKELSDATKQFPFTNDGMEETALDPQTRREARQAAGGRRRDGKIIELAYLRIKGRTRDALWACRMQSRKLASGGYTSAFHSRPRRQNHPLPREGCRKNKISPCTGPTMKSKSADLTVTGQQ